MKLIINVVCLFVLCVSSAFAKETNTHEYIRLVLEGRKYFEEARFDLAQEETEQQLAAQLKALAAYEYASLIRPWTFEPYYHIHLICESKWRDDRKNATGKKWLDKMEHHMDIARKYKSLRKRQFIISHSARNAIRLDKLDKATGILDEGIQHVKYESQLIEFEWNYQTIYERHKAKAAKSTDEQKRKEHLQKAHHAKIAMDIVKILQW